MNKSISVASNRNSSFVYLVLSTQSTCMYHHIFTFSKYICVDRWTMYRNFILSKRIRQAFHSTLLDSAIALEKCHWLIITNHHDDKNTNTLASFLGLWYADTVDLFMQQLLGIIYHHICHHCSFNSSHGCYSCTEYYNKTFNSEISSTYWVHDNLYYHSNWVHLLTHVYFRDANHYGSWQSTTNLWIVLWAIELKLMLLLVIQISSGTKLSLRAMHSHGIALSWHCTLSWCCTVLAPQGPPYKQSGPVCL